MKKLLSVILASVFPLLTASPALAADIIPPVEPTLTLFVEVDETCKNNVKFTARLEGSSPILGGPAAVTVEFYTGSPMLCVYPNVYLGKATPDEKGIAVFETWQEPGSYAGGAIIKSPVYGQLFANVVFYEIKEPEPVLPVLKLTAEVVGGISGNLNNNVVFNAKIIYPDGYIGIMVLPKPMKIDFYTGNPLVDMYPADLAGTATMINGEVQLAVPVAPGDYAGGAVIEDSPWGKLYAPQIYFTVPKVGLLLDMKASVTSGRSSTVTFDTVVRVDYYRPATGTPGWPTGSVKVDFYAGRKGENTPMKLVGSSTTNRSGYATFSFTQASGEYVGMAVCATKPYGVFQSNLIEYKVPPVSILPFFQQLWAFLLRAFGIRF